MLIKRSLGLFILILLSSSVLAETVYVSDIQFVAVREGLDNSSRAIERGLKSGTPLEVLQKNNGFTRVKTPNGNEGWVANYFLSKDLVTRQQLNNLQNRIKETIQSRAEIADTLTTTLNQVEELNKLVASLEQENTDLKKQIKDVTILSEKAQSILANHDDVNYQIKSLQQQTNAAFKQAEDLRNSHTQQWFIIGAATLFGGIVVGTLLPTLLRRKKVATGPSWS